MKNKFKRIKSLILILLLTLMTISTNIRITKAEALDSDVVTFKDANLEAAVRSKLGKSTGDITVGDMKKMTGTFNIALKKISDLSGLEYAVNITTLNLSYNQISDITPISNMTKLESLYLYNNKIKSLDPLEKMTSLRILNASINEIADISVISNLTNLEQLNLYSNQVISIESLRGLQKLTNLQLENNQIVDIEPLSGLTQLKTLGLKANNITNVTPLRDISNLSTLTLNSNQISDISALSGLINLSSLYLGDNQISSISALSELTNLTILDLKNNQITDISALSKLTNITTLYLNNNQITDITPLGHMNKLEYLYSNNNQITDISTLGDMPNIKVLLLKNNKISEIPELIGNFLNLNYLDFRNNNLQGELPIYLDNLINLKYWDRYNQYTSFSGNYLTGTVSETLKNRLGEEAFYNNLLEGENNQKQLTLIDGAELNLSLNSTVTSNTLKSITQLFDGEDSHSKSLYELELVPVEEEYFDESGRTIKSGTTTAYIRIKDIADTNLYAKTLTPVQVNISDKIGSNNDLTIDFSIDNTLEVTLGTNNINFGVVSSIGGEIETTTLTVTSSLPYDISTKAYDDFIGDLDPSNIIPIEKVSLDIDDLGYMELSKEKVLNLGNNPSAIDKIHNLNFKISDTLGYKKDNYRTELQFIIDTK